MPCGSLPSDSVAAVSKYWKEIQLWSFGSKQDIWTTQYYVCKDDLVSKAKTTSLCELQCREQ